MTRKPAPDQAARDRAIDARGVNVIVDAGAGTGKTTLLVARLVEMVAPSDDALAAVPLSRVAAITFTRKAAGELKLGIREALLGALAGEVLTPARRARLSGALGALDTAHVGTIHSFADRLLRLRPVEAWLSPSYDVVEDASALVREGFGELLHAVEAGRLAAELVGTPAAAIAADAQAAYLDALRAGIRVESRLHDYGEWAGLDRLFARLVETRDVPPIAPPAQPPDLARFRGLVDELDGLARGSAGDGAGSRYVADLSRRLRALRDEEDPIAVLKRLLWIARVPARFRKGADFPDDDAGWRAYKALVGDGGKSPVRATPLLDDLLRPFHGFMARRLVAAAPAAVAVYEKVKARHRAVDQVDLLLRLRDLLRKRPDVRAEYQALFDHVFVDEFQDTDPLQAEIVLYLCEQGATARSWREVTLAPGKLTLVGDPKQSIYRFRRADIAVYAAVRDIVRKGPHVAAKLEANFRCHPGLVAWLNARFDDVLGKAEEDEPAFDADLGTVVNEPLVAGREGAPAPRVIVLPLAADPGLKPDYRRAEARALATFLRSLVEGKRRAIAERSTGAERPAGYGDVAILAASTLHLPLLFPELDRLAIPYSARGGTLFLDDPLHRRFLLALRAVADRDDGVAQAALLGPPFFAVDLEDLARERAAEEGSTHPGVLRARAALAFVRDLRRRRLERSPGATARDVLERTALGRHAALGPNGAQRLDALHELCLALDAVAAAEGLDFDGATARLREWAIDPVQLDPPRPVAADAVQILTTHQAKGLEFPVVVLWDACQDLDARDVRGAFVVGGNGAAWSVELEDLEWEEPEGSGLAARERRYLDAERRRLLYVAATRARDLLVLPVAGDPNPAYATGRLVGGAPAELMEALETYAIEAEPAWATEVPAAAPRPRDEIGSTRRSRLDTGGPLGGDARALASEVAAAWRAAAEEAARPRFAPTSVTAEAHRPDEDEGRPGETTLRPARESRFGSVFGDTVHRAIGLALRSALSPEGAVERAARATGLTQWRAEAAADVARALAALERAGLRRPPGADLRLEYPIALAEGGGLVSGYVDLLGIRGGRLAVVDFKTDAPPPRGPQVSRRLRRVNQISPGGDVLASHPAYVQQVRTYARIVETLGLAAPGSVEAGLLFTAEDEVRWVSRS